MPIIRSAKKKMRQDKKRTLRNKRYESAYKKIIDQVKKSKKKEQVAVLLKKAYSAIDKAVKKRVIHKNKGARLKSNLAKYLLK